MSTFSVTSSTTGSAPNPDATPFEPAALRAGPTPPQAVDNAGPRQMAAPFNPAAQAFRAWQPPQPQPWQATAAPAATYAAKQPMVASATYQTAPAQMLYTYFPQQMQQATFATAAQQQALQQQQQQQQQQQRFLQQTDQQQRLRQSAPALPPGTTMPAAAAHTAAQPVGVYGQAQAAPGVLPVASAQPAQSAPPRSSPPPAAAAAPGAANIDVRQFVADAAASDLVPRNTYTSWILALAEGSEQARTFLDAYTELLTLTQTDVASVSRASADAAFSHASSGSALASLRA